MEAGVPACRDPQSGGRSWTAPPTCYARLAAESGTRSATPVTSGLGRIFAAQEAGLHEVSSWEGLQRWCDHWVTATRATDGAGGCPLGSLAGELADQSEPARRVLAQCPAEWQSYLSEGFQAMRDKGELAARADPAALALTVMSALQGGLLMAQAARSARPLELALNMALQHMAAYRRRPKQAARR